MKNSYYLITLPADKSRSRVDQFIAKGMQTKSPLANLHTRWNNDRTKVIVQGEIPDELEKFIAGKSFIQYLGDYNDSGTQKKVKDYINENRSEWVLNIPE